jgi:hypothetical protein
VTSDKRFSKEPSRDFVLTKCSYQICNKNATEKFVCISVKFVQISHITRRRTELISIAAAPRLFRPRPTNINS